MLATSNPGFYGIASKTVGRKVLKTKFHNFIRNGVFFMLSVVCDIEINKFIDWERRAARENQVKD